MRILSLLFIMIISLSAYADLQMASFTNNVEANNRIGLSPVIIMESSYTYNKTVSNLKKAIDGRNYRLIRIQKVDQTYVEKNRESKDLIVYFCNFNMVNKAIKVDNRIGQFLPCRITVIERNGKVYLMAMNPKAISKIVGNVKLKETCNKVTNMYMDIMDEATI